jgi:hypothetical protein
MRRVLVGLALLGAGLIPPASPAEARVIMNTIGPTAALIGHGHVARGTVLLECTAGEHVRFTLTLTQPGASGTGRGAGVCTGELTAFKVTVPAKGARFTEGTATACATAIDSARGVVVETRQWCRAAGVTLTAS